ncbi:MAG: hypothetical protein K8R39_09175 [Arcobacteraceae bacterium]|nr:hypothetical protein [Arcobacteraceae bacterium]
MYNEIILDCRELEAPEPLNLAVSSLSKLDDNNYIKMIHRLEPMMLLTILKENNYGYDIKYTSNEVLIYIYKNDEKKREYIKCLQD